MHCCRFSPGQRRGCRQHPAHGSACCRSAPACQLAGGLLPVPAAVEANMIVQPSCLWSAVAGVPCCICTMQGSAAGGQLGCRPRLSDAGNKLRQAACCRQSTSSQPGLTWASVFITYISTPVSWLASMRLTAFEPPPPTPTTCTHGCGPSQLPAGSAFWCNDDTAPCQLLPTLIFASPVTAPAWACTDFLLGLLGGSHSPLSPPAWPLI